MMDDGENEASRRQLILTHVADLVSDFLYYNRKEDEDLPVGAIQDAVGEGEITADEIVAKFRECLESGLAV